MVFKLTERTLYWLKQVQGPVCAIFTLQRVKIAQKPLICPVFSVKNELLIILLMSCLLYRCETNGELKVFRDLGMV